MFKLALTNPNPGAPQNVQRGGPAPGSGAQTVGPYTPGPKATAWASKRPTKGKRTWRFLSPQSLQVEHPGAQNELQARPAKGDGSMPARQQINGLPTPVYVEDYSRGAAAVVQNYGQLLYNPIGAGIVADQPFAPYYEGAAQYFDHAIWWTNQEIPTSIGTTAMLFPQTMEALLGTLRVEGVVRTV